MISNKMLSKRNKRVKRSQKNMEDIYNYRKASETVWAMLVVQETELRGWLLFTCEGRGKGGWGCSHFEKA